MNSMEPGRQVENDFHIEYKYRAVAVLAVAALLCFLSRSFHLDDGMIYARYMAHALHGRGFQFNDGEPINALTSILNTWLLLPLSWMLRGNILLAQLLLGGACLAGAALLAEYAVPFAGLFVVAGPFFYFCNGMETTLFLFLLALCAAAYTEGRIDWLPLLCALCVLVRFEGGTIAVVIAWQLWKTRRFPRAVAWLPVVLLAGLYFAFNWHYYHQAFPHSAGAKFGQAFSGAWGPWPTAFLKIPDVAGLWIYGPAIAVLAWFGRRDPRMATMNAVVWPFLILLGVFYVLMNIPDYHWYYAPFLFFFLVYATRLLPQTRDAYTAAAMIVVLLAGATGAYLYRGRTNYQDYVHTAEWLAQNTPANARIAAAETGNLGWYCDRYIVDMVGLTTPRNAEFTAKGDFSSWLQDKPDYIVVHPDSPFRWEKVALASPEYEFIPVHFGAVWVLQRKSTPAAAR
jgi:arabinofuranosyltransferase